jgi:hypothetical protein
MYNTYLSTYICFKSYNVYTHLNVMFQILTTYPTLVDTHISAHTRAITRLSMSVQPWETRSAGLCISKYSSRLLCCVLAKCLPILIICVNLENIWLWSITVCNPTLLCQAVFTQRAELYSVYIVVLTYWGYVHEIAYICFTDGDWSYLCLVCIYVVQWLHSL